MAGTTGKPDVPFAATFAGHLHYRGMIMSYAQGDTKLRLRHWPDEVILAYSPQTSRDTENSVRSSRRSVYVNGQAVRDRGGVHEGLSRIPKAPCRRKS